MSRRNTPRRSSTIIFRWAADDATSWRTKCTSRRDRDCSRNEDEQDDRADRPPPEDSARRSEQEGDVREEVQRGSAAESDCLHRMERLADVAERLGAKSRNAYARYEQGESVPTADKLMELLVALDPGRDFVLSEAAV